MVKSNQASIDRRQFGAQRYCTVPHAQCIQIIKCHDTIESNSPDAKFAIVTGIVSGQDGVLHGGSNGGLAPPIARNAEAQQSQEELK